MIISFIFLFVILIIDISIYFTNLTAIRPHGNILMAVTIPYKFLDNKEVNEIISNYKKAYKKFCLYFLLASIPIFFLKYISFILLYTFIYMTLFIYINEKIFVFYNKKLFKLKHNNNWSLGNKHIINIDTKVSQMKNKMVISIFWFLPSFIFSIVPFIKKSPNSFINTNLFSMFMLLSYLFLYLLTFKSKTKVYSSDSKINFLCNKLYKSSWSLCWITLSTLQSFFTTLLLYLSRDYFKPTFIFIILFITSNLFIIFITFNSVREKQNIIFKTMENPIYIDDDEYWINGYYYNPNDNRTTVEKRVGYGYTFNMATKKGKIFTYGSLIGTTVLVLGLSIIFFIFDFSTFQLSIKNEVLSIKAPIYGTEVNLNEIKEVTLINSIPKGSRTNGFSSNEINLGNYNLKNYGKCKLYVYNNSYPIILIKLKNNYILFNNKSKEETMVYYNEILKNINFEVAS